MYGFTQIADKPTCINKVHESVYRASHILRIVERLARHGAPTKTILAVIEELNALPQKEAGPEEIGNDLSAQTT